MTKQTKRNHLKNNHYLVVAGDTVVFVGSAAEAGEFLDMTGNMIASYAGSTTCIDGRYYVFSFHNVKYLEEVIVNHSNEYNLMLASNAMTHIDMLRRRLMDAIEQHDYDAVDVIDKYVRMSLSKDKLISYLEERGKYKIEHD